jgi:hypothetical protein
MNLTEKLFFTKNGLKCSEKLMHHHNLEQVYKNITLTNGSDQNFSESVEQVLDIRESISNILDS